MGSHLQHRSVKTSSPVTGSFAQGGISESLSGYFIGKFEFYALLHRRSFCITYERPNNYAQPVRKIGQVMYDMTKTALAHNTQLYFTNAQVQLLKH